MKVVKIQNAKLYARLEEKNAQEEEFKVRFAKLERLRNNDQNIISSMNVAWNQVGLCFLFALPFFKFFYNALYCWFSSLVKMFSILLVFFHCLFTICDDPAKSWVTYMFLNSCILHYKLQNLALSWDNGVQFLKSFWIHRLPM